MNTHQTYPAAILFAVIVMSLFLAPANQAQTPDSNSAPRARGAALQVQLLRNVGVYYFGPWGSSSYFRIGADASFSGSGTSGTTESSDNYSGSSGSSMKGSPEGTTSSFSIDLSALWVQTIAEYARCSLYFGAGPMISYGGSGQNTSSTDHDITYPPGNSSTTAFDDKSRSWGAGPLALLGIRAHIVGPVNVTAEMSAYVIYQWSTSSSVSTMVSNSTYYTPNPYVSVHTSSSDTHGWSYGLNSIAVGVVIEI